MHDETFPALGKITSGFFERTIAPRLGAAAKEVRVGPRTGVDSAIVSLGGGRVMAVTTDPFFVDPIFGWARAGWFAVHILASDVATSGLRPRYLSVDLNLPLEMSEADFDALWASVDATCKALGVAVVAGHTGRYPGCHYPMLGGATMIALGADDAFVSVGMSMPGDAVIMTKSAAIEAAGLFAAGFRQEMEAAFGADFAARADTLFERMTTVEDARIAASVGVRERGVTAMHDATEGGVYGALFEMADAADLGMRIDGRAILIEDEVGAICEHYGMSPFSAISEGTLLITCGARRVDAVLAALEAGGVPASVIGSCEQQRGVRVMANGSQKTLDYPETDPFWAAWGRALASRADEA